MDGTLALHKPAINELSFVCRKLSSCSVLTASCRWRRFNVAQLLCIDGKKKGRSSVLNRQLGLPHLYQKHWPATDPVKRRCLSEVRAIVASDKDLNASLEGYSRKHDSSLRTMCLLQAFNWTTHKGGGDGHSWYRVLLDKVEEFAAAGFTDVLLPPCCQASDPQGFMPADFYNLSSSYGSEDELKELLQAIHKQGMRACVELVVNRLASVPVDGSTRWKAVGGLVDEDVDWDDWITASGFQGQPLELDDEYGVLGSINHANAVIQSDVKGWLLWLTADIGFDGWCFDYAKAFDPLAVRIYCEVARPAFVAADVWNPMRYNGMNLEYDQDQHRQELCSWVKASRTSAAVFDYTTKGILQQAVQSCEYWRLIDPKGRPPGLIGWWPSKAVTFVDNHSTGSEPAHWPFPAWGVILGYAYILTHPGIPCIFWDHVYDWGLKDAILALLAIRRRAGIHFSSEVKICACSSHLYIAKVGSNPDTKDFKGLYMKLGPSMDLAGCGPGDDWEVTHSGNSYCVWERVKRS